MVYNRDLTALLAGLRLNNSGAGKSVLVAFFHGTVIDAVNIVVMTLYRARRHQGKRARSQFTPSPTPTKATDMSLTLAVSLSVPKIPLPPDFASFAVLTGTRKPVWLRAWFGSSSFAVRASVQA